MSDRFRVDVCDALVDAFEEMNVMLCTFNSACKRHLLDTLVLDASLAYDVADGA